MSELDHIYLDNAATSFPKPATVYDVMARYNRECGAPVGRGNYREASQLEHRVAQCRQQAARLLGAGPPERIAFTFNGTDSRHLAIHGRVAPGDHVVTPVIEHNSVLRPLRELERRRGVEVDRVDCNDEGLVEPAAIKAAICSRTRLIVVTQASNVTGTLQPIAEIGEIARQKGIPFVVDGAQSAGHVSQSLADLPIDVFACSGHKGLLGPLGTGLLYVREGLEDQLHSVRQGGTGSQSEQDVQPDRLPDKYEPGNHNAPGLIGLAAAIDYLLERTIADVNKHEHFLTMRLIEGIQSRTRLSIIGPTDSKTPRVSVVSVTSDEFEPQILAGILDETYRIQVRAGLHCAPLVHRRMGTADGGGTVRFSVGPFTTPDEIDRTVAALAEISPV